jgi:hypothetical protein
MTDGPLAPDALGCSNRAKHSAVHIKQKGVERLIEGGQIGQNKVLGISCQLWAKNRVGLFVRDHNAEMRAKSQYSTDESRLSWREYEKSDAPPILRVLDLATKLDHLPSLWLFAPPDTTSKRRERIAA